ncbi:MAG: outer membrane protein assembly factor BamB family protein [Acidobacteriota bacterium]
MLHLTWRRRRASCLALPAIACAIWLVSEPHLTAQGAGRADTKATASPWPQWGGPSRNFIVESAGLADQWPASGPPVVWSRPLGTGHSAIVADEGRLYTMYRSGNGRARQGPWAAEESVIALDAATGATLWEHKYPSRREDFSFGAGPHSTPLIVGERLFTIGTNKQLFAFDKRTGHVLWSHDLIKTFKSPELLIRPVVKTGYGCSPIAFRDTIICSVGGPGQSVMAFRQSDGTVVWRSGDFLTSESPPILIDFAGRPQLVFLAGGTITGMDPATGHVLWAHPHDPGNDLNCGTPIWGPDNIVFVSSAYKAGSRAIRLTDHGGVTVTEELWFTNRVRFMFLNAVRLGDFVYGTTGDFGPAFLTALNLKTGQAAWQHRGFGRASLVYADGKAIIMDEDGDLALARLSPEGVTILAEAKVFDTTSWTVPTLAGTTLYVRDREKIVALDLGTPGGASESARARRTTAAFGMTAPVSAKAGSAGEAKGGSIGLKAPASFGGTWRLDRAASRIEDAAGLLGLIGAGAPPMLHITQPTNGTLVVESPINEGHARIYRPGGKTVTPAGQGGSISMTAAWAGAVLTGEGSAISASGSTVNVKESYAISADGRTLTIEVIASSAQQSSSLKYTRIDDVGGCESWPTPCKRSP